MNKNKSPLAAILSKVKEAEQRGVRDIINLAIGEPDFAVSDSIKNGLIEKIKNNGKEIDGYTETLGIKPLRQAIAKRFNNDLKGGKWTNEDVIVTSGAKFALAAAIRAVVMNSVSTDNKPAIAILNPSWPTFATQVKLMGAIPVFIDVFEKDVTFEVLSKATEGFNLKVIIINSPSNPTGRILKKEELNAVGEFAKKNNIWIISDEIYRRISYIQLPPPMAYFAPNRTITIGGFSKEYAMTGWRLGWAFAPQEIISEMEAYQSSLISCASSIVQYAGLFAMESNEADKAADGMVKEFARRREIAGKKLAQIPEVTFQDPDGAFYFFINVKEYLGRELKTSEALTNYLFETARVAVVPGSVFGAEGYIRLSFAASEGNLVEAIERIKTALLKLR